MSPVAKSSWECCGTELINRVLMLMEVRDEQSLPALEGSAKALADHCQRVWERLCSSHPARAFPGEGICWITPRIYTLLCKWQRNQPWLEASACKWRAGTLRGVFPVEKQQMRHYLKYYFGNSGLNSGLMSTQIFFGYRTWVNRVKSRFCWLFFLFTFMPKYTGSEHLNTKSILNVGHFFSLICPSYFS